MRRFSQVSLFLFFGLIGSVLVQSCCEKNITIIGNGNVNAYYITNSDLVETDTVNQETTLRRHLESSYAALGNFSFIQSCYATSCDEVFKNELIPSSLEISCSADFIYDGEPISQNSNFITLEELEINVEELYGSVQITFTDDFLAKAEFDSSEYTFTLKINTTDQKEFVNSVVLYVNI